MSPTPPDLLRPFCPPSLPLSICSLRVWQGRLCLCKLTIKNSVGIFQYISSTRDYCVYRGHPLTPDLRQPGLKYQRIILHLNTHTHTLDTTVAQPSTNVQYVLHREIRLK
jgi:hypothetical protein